MVIVHESCPNHSIIYKNKKVVFDLNNKLKPFRSNYSPSQPIYPIQAQAQTQSHTQTQAQTQTQARQQAHSMVESSNKAQELVQPNSKKYSDRRKYDSDTPATLPNQLYSNLLNEKKPQAIDFTDNSASTVVPIGKDMDTIITRYKSVRDQNLHNTKTQQHMDTAKSWIINNRDKDDDGLDMPSDLSITDIVDNKEPVDLFGFLKKKPKEKNPLLIKLLALQSNMQESMSKLAKLLQELDESI